MYVYVYIYINIYICKYIYIYIYIYNIDIYIYKIYPKCTNFPIKYSIFTASRQSFVCSWFDACSSLLLLVLLPLIHAKITINYCMSPRVTTYDPRDTSSQNVTVISFPVEILDKQNVNKKSLLWLLNNWIRNSSFHCPNKVLSKIGTWSCNQSQK